MDTGMSGSDFREIRLRAGLTQPQVAHAAGVTQQRISEVELGKRPVSERLIDAILALDPELGGQLDATAREIDARRGPMTTKPTKRRGPPETEDRRG